MKIVGCDLHTRYQQIAMLDQEMGELRSVRRHNAIRPSTAIFKGRTFSQMMSVRPIVVEAGRMVRPSRRRQYLLLAWLLAAGVSIASGLGGQATSKDVPQNSSPVASSRLQPGPYYALVIGNDNYQRLNKLKTAVNDANEVARILRERYGFETNLLLNATRSQILTALVEYRSSLPADSSLLIYYAGHGHHDRDTDEAYWLPIDAQPDNNQNWISADDITRDVRAMRASHVLVISDSCYSGFLTRDTVAAIDPKERSAYLEKMLKSKSRNLMSSGGDEPVTDSGAPGHSVFAAAILESLLEMEEVNFTAGDLFQRFIQPRVGGRSGQLPQYSWIRNSGHNAGDFVFTRQPAPKSSSGDGAPRVASTESAVASEPGTSTAASSPRSSASSSPDTLANVPPRHISGWIVGPEVILHTEDGGHSWQQQMGGEEKVCFAGCGGTSVAFITPEKGWAVGRHGDILHTDNAGQTWEKQRRGDEGELFSVAFVTPETGWAVGTDEHFKGVILHTNNGGRTWAPQSSGAAPLLASVTFVTAQSGWTVGQSGTLLHTLDGGGTWHLQKQDSVVGVTLWSVAFVAPRLGWAAGDDGAILHTEDSGRSWQNQRSNTDQRLNSITFVTPQSGYAAGDGGVILHTEDGGRTWEKQNSGTQSTINSIRFVAPQWGWAVGESGTMLHTEDGGRTWSRQNPHEFGAELKDIVFANQQ